jgi:hypothetical protein
LHRTRCATQRDNGASAIGCRYAAAYRLKRPRSYLASTDGSDSARREITRVMPRKMNA